jgi:hypothetical protein
MAIAESDRRCRRRELFRRLKPGRSYPPVDLHGGLAVARRAKQYFALLAGWQFSGNLACFPRSDEKALLECEFVLDALSHNELQFWSWCHPEDPCACCNANNRNPGGSFPFYAVPVRRDGSFDTRTASFLPWSLRTGHWPETCESIRGSPSRDCPLWRDLMSRTRM